MITERKIAALLKRGILAGVAMCACIALAVCPVSAAWAWVNDAGLVGFFIILWWIFHMSRKP